MRHHHHLSLDGEVGQYQVPPAPRTPSELLVHPPTQGEVVTAGLGIYGKAVATAPSAHPCRGPGVWEGAPSFHCPGDSQFQACYLPPSWAQLHCPPAGGCQAPASPDTLWAQTHKLLRPPSSVHTAVPGWASPLLPGEDQVSVLLLRPQVLASELAFQSQAQQE